MALRVLTDKERQTLLNSEDFVEKCKWAARDYAAFKSIDDGSSALSEDDRIKWAKDRLVGVGIVINDINDQLIAIRFLNLSKAKEFDLDVAPQPIEVLLQAWVDSNAFQEFVPKYFDIVGEPINFSVGDN